MVRYSDHLNPFKVLFSTVHTNSGVLIKIALPLQAESQAVAAVAVPNMEPPEPERPEGADDFAGTRCLERLQASVSKH